MPIIKVTPIIGEVMFNSRLDSMRGCHALNEYAVNQRCDRLDEMGMVIQEAIAQIMLTKQFRESRASELNFVVSFRD